MVVASGSDKPDLADRQLADALVNSGEHVGVDQTGRAMALAMMPSPAR